MADDSKISLLPDADALDGAEISPLVQAGGTKKTLLSTIRTWLATTFASGPVSSTDNAIVRFDGTSGKTVQNSAITIADTTGEISGGGLLKSTVSDGSSAVGYVLDTTNALSTSGAKLLSLKNSGTEKFYVDKDGKISSPSISVFGATLIDDSDASAARSTLGLGTAATSASGDFATAAHNHTGTYVPVGADAADLGSGAATDNYVLTADGLGGASWEAVTTRAELHAVALSF